MIFNYDVSDLNTAINGITPLDTVPTNGSTKGITSDAVYDILPISGYDAGKEAWYIKFSDGTMLQRGQITKSSGDAHVDITLPITFVGTDTAPFVFIPALRFVSNETSQVRLIPNITAMNTVRVYTRELASDTFYTGETKIMWIAMGRWK